MKAFTQAGPWLYAALSGLLLTLAFPPIQWYPLAAVALVPLWSAALDARDLKSAANLGGVAGLVFYSLSLRWLAKVFGPGAIAFWCLFALWTAFHACILRWLWQRTELGRGWIKDLGWALAAGIVWVGLEYFRSEVWRLNCSWLALGYSQTADLPLLQSASLWGLYGISGLLAATNAGVCLLIRRRWIACAAAVAALGAVLLWGRHRIAAFAADGGRPLKVSLIQDESYDLNRLAKLSLGPGALDAALLVWPEYAISVTPGLEARTVELIHRRLAGSGAVAVVGAAIFPEDFKKGKEQNFAWVISPEGALLGRYDKLHPIPFVEKFLPPNPSPHPVRAPVGSLGIQICYDLDFEDGPRRMAREGAELLVVPDIDPREWGLWQHRQHSWMSPVRAVETGLWIARAASSGLSQIIDPLGRIRVSMTSMDSAALVGSVRLRTPGTFYSRLGWLSAPLCLLATAGVLVWMLADRLRRAGGPGAR